MKGKTVILIVDDEFHIVNALKRSLHRMDCEVLCATDPEDAISIINNSELDIVICDYCMPNINGIDVLRHSRKIMPNAFRVLMTGYSDIDITITAINEGCIFYYITKPWTSEQLASMLRRALEIKRNMREQAAKKQLLNDCTGCITGAIEKLKQDSEYSRLPLQDNGDFHLISKNDILYLTAEAGEVLVFTMHRIYRSRESLNSWSKKLDTGKFFRCHRSYIVNVERVDRISPWFNGAYNLKLKDCREIIPVSRENANTLKDLFGI